jgi:hypothetical protein
MNSAATNWSAETVLGLARTYQGAVVLGAAADLDLFSAIARAPATATALAADRACDPRGLTVLLDALTALGLLNKAGHVYHLAAGVKACLSADNPGNVLAMAQHQANCLRRWAQLATVVKTGRPAPELPSVRGAAGDQAAFIGAMDNVSAPVADRVIESLGPLAFKHLLDVGGASGTWTIAFLRACPGGRATLFDLPEVLPLARARLERVGLLERVRLVAGDYNRDELPGDADLAWVSAIVHQNSREQNRAMLARVWRALRPEGQVAIRDLVMEPDRVHPEAGALFAVNMLVATDGGGTFTFEELAADLAAAGFGPARRVRDDPGMNAIVTATRAGSR